MEQRKPLLRLFGRSGRHGGADLGASRRVVFAFAADYTRAHGGEVHEPDLATLFCAAIPASLFRAVGGLDERYRIGMFEDDDLTLEIRARGRRVILARDVFVHHYGGAAFAEMPRSRYLKVWWQNRRRFEEKWGQAWRPR